MYGLDNVSASDTTATVCYSPCPRPPPPMTRNAARPCTCCCCCCCCHHCLTCILHTLHTRVLGALQQIANKTLKLGTVIRRQEMDKKTRWSAASRIDDNKSYKHGEYNGATTCSYRTLTTKANHSTTAAPLPPPTSHRVSVTAKCLGPLASAVMKGRLMSVLAVLLSSHLAFSAASRRR